LASENLVEEVSDQEKTDVILRRQGECAEQRQLQANQVSVLDLELKSDVETVDPLENRQIDLTDESQTVELSNPEQTDVILRRQGEQAEQRLIEENCVENFDSDEVKAKENIPECNGVSFILHTPCVEKENVNSLCIPRPSTKTEIVGVKASRANCFASYIIVSNRLNDSKRVLLSFKDSFEMFHWKQLGEVLQISVPTKNCSNKLEHKCPKRCKSRYQQEVELAPKERRKKADTGSALKLYVL
jgi:hypothetical protein